MFRRRRRTLLFCLMFVSTASFIAVHFAEEISIYLTYYRENRTCTNQDPMWKHLTIVRTGGKKQLQINCIPSVPRISSVGFTPILDTMISDTYLKLPSPQSYKDRVMILCLLKDTARYLPAFVHQLSQLSYPHHLVSIYFGKEGKYDNTFKTAVNLAKTLVTEHGFNKTKVHKLSINMTRDTRLEASKQLQRMSRMATARNLLKKSLKDELWVLWIDSEVISFRHDVIQQFLYSRKDVMAASTILECTYFGNLQGHCPYDLNTFREKTENGKQVRLFPDDLKEEGREAKVDHVGVYMLMIRAFCLRIGLRFPEQPYSPDLTVEQYSLEVDGIGKLARAMGFTVYTLPFLEVIHA